MARGLHPTCESKDIIADLQEKGYKILAANIIKVDKTISNVAKQKVGLPLFMLV